jgi:Dolichyl-phosphate-mannose-protein mannosyltransferase
VTDPSRTSPVEPPPGRRRLLALVVLLAVPFFLRLWPIEHGFPTTSYVPDTHIVRSALGMARDKDPVPPVGKYSTYPNLLPYLLLPIYTVQYGIGRATGAWGGAQEYGLRLLEQPARAHLPARVLVAVLGALTVWLVLRAGRAMGLGVGAWIAAWLVATSLLHVQFSTQERPWVPLVTFLALAAWPAARYVRAGVPRDLHLTGLAAALAFSCHQAGGLVLGLAGLAWLLGPPGWRGPDLKERLRRGAVCVGLFAVLSLAVGHPYYLVHGLVSQDQVAAGEALGGNAFTFGGQALVFALRPETFLKLGRAFVGYDPLLLLLGLGGLGLALMRREARPAGLFALAWAAFFLTNQGDHIRYLLPLVVLLAWPAGFLAERLWSRRPARIALLVLCAFPFVQALRLDWVLRRQDTRAEAAEVLGADYPEAEVAIDLWGPELPLERASLERLAAHRDLSARERHRLAYWTEWNSEPPGGPGLRAFPVEAIFDTAQRFHGAWVEEDEVEALGSDPTTALHRLGLTHVLVVDRWPDQGPPLLLDPRTEAVDEQGEPVPKMAPLRLAGGPLWSVSPGSAGDASLPNELTFALTQIWRVTRPGPALALYELAD